MLKRSLLFMMIALTAPLMAALMHIRDFARPIGERDNQLSGVGLVVGLGGTGDTQASSFTEQAIGNLLTNFGIDNPQAQIQTKNVATVMVQAQMESYLKQGDHFDILVSSLGDATSLAGGALIQTPLKGANGMVYAVAQGPISLGEQLGGRIGGLLAAQGRTTGRVPNGAIVENEVPATVVGEENLIRYVLRQPDYTTAARTAMAINATLGQIKPDYGDSAKAVDASTIEIHVPTDFQDYPTDFIAAVEQVQVDVEEKSDRVVVNERTGTVVMGMNVMIDTVAVAHGNLNVNVQTTDQVSQPAWYSPGQSALYYKNSDFNVKGGGGNMVALPANANVADLVNALNTIGASPRDLISILQAIRAAGALHGDLEIL